MLNLSFENYHLITKILFLLINTLGIWIILWVFFSDVKNKQNKYFSLMGFLILSWISFGYFANVENTYSLSLIWTKIAAASALLFLVSAYIFILNFIQKDKIYFLLNFFVILLGFVFSGITIFTNLFFEGVISTQYGFLPKIGSFWGIFNTFAISLGFLIFLIAIRKFLKLPVSEKIKIQYFLIGFSIFILANIFFNTLILVFYQTYHLYQFGNYSAIFFLGFTAYAIVKRELFGIRVVLTALLVGAIAILLGLDIFVFTSDLTMRLYKGLVLLVFLYFGYLLIRSVLREIEYRERVQRAYEIEKKAKEEIEKITEAKTQFIMATQHHLRTPLTSMIGYLDLIFGGTYGKVPEKLKDPLMKFKVSARRLVRIVNALLDISQFQMGKEVVSLQSGVNFEDLIKEVMEELQFEAKIRGLYLKYQKTGQTPNIKADPEKLKVALFNIIDNAIKYTKQGGITITLSKIADKSVQLIVRDTGIGLDPEKAKQLFSSAFVRGKEAKKVHGLGRGIGVYVTAHIIKAHNGKIWAESEGPGKGTTFFIELPVG